MISPRVFLFATLTLAAINNAQASLNLDAPVNFNYKAGDILDINIFLQCVPKTATTLALYYQTENCDVYPDSCAGLVRYEKIPENKTITIKEPLNKPILTIYMELYKRTEETRVVNKIVILKGLKDEYANNNFRKNCLNKQNQHYSKCQITVNFGNQCEERAVIIGCTQKEHLTCEVGDEELPEDTVHQWYQVYENGSLIKHMPQLKGKRTEFKMTLQKFDNNTKIYSIMNSAHWEKDLVSQEFKVSLPKDGFKDYDIQNTMQYAEHEKIQFFCSNNTNTRVGWIDPTVGNITLLNGTSFFGALSKKGNNGMFCCISYNIRYVHNKMVVERIVYNITLIKVKPENQDNVKASQNSGDTNKTQQDPGKTNGLNKNTNTTDETNKKVDNEVGKEANDAKNYYLIIIIIISSISAIMAVVLISILIKIRYWKKNNQIQRPRPPIPLPPTQLAPYTPFYENVALRGDCELPTQEEPHYEEVLYH